MGEVQGEKTPRRPPARRGLKPHTGLDMKQPPKKEDERKNLRASPLSLALPHGGGRGSTAGGVLNVKHRRNAGSILSTLPRRGVKVSRLWREKHRGRDALVPRDAVEGRVPLLPGMRIRSSFVFPALTCPPTLARPHRDQSLPP